MDPLNFYYVGREQHSDAPAAINSAPHVNDVAGQCIFAGLCLLLLAMAILIVRNA